MWLAPGPVRASCPVRSRFSSCWLLVAHHTGAPIEAEERNLPEYIDEFAQPDGLLLEALTYCDMTSAVDGVPTDVDQRSRKSSPATRRATLSIGRSPSPHQPSERPPATLPKD